jgi:hypothetical protein
METGHFVKVKVRQISIHKWLFSVISASIGGIACAVHRSMPPRNAADFLELAKNGTFMGRKHISAWHETEDGH